MNMKKIAILLGVFLLVACGTKPTIKEDYLYFLFATPLYEHPVWLKAKDGFQDACKTLAVKCDWIGPATIDTERMNEVIETGIAQKTNAIITQGVVSEALLERAYQNNIPVILVDSDMEQSHRFAYIGKDFKNQAELLLKDIEKKKGKDTFLKIAIQVAEASFAIAQDQVKEVEKAFQKHPGGFEIVSISESKSDQVRAKKEWTRVLEADKDIHVAINFAGESAESCAEIAKNMELRQDMLIYGVDDMENTLQLIRNGEIDGSIVTSFYNYGYGSVEMLYDYIKNNKRVAQSKQANPLIIVDKGNIDIYKEELIGK